MTKERRIGTEARPVRRLLRRCDTREYYKEDGWTANPDEAKWFSDVVEVAEVCAQHGLSGVEMILRLEGGATEVFSTPMR